MKLRVPSAFLRGTSCHQEMGLPFSSTKRRKSVEARLPCLLFFVLFYFGGGGRWVGDEKVGGRGGGGVSALSLSPVAWLAAVFVFLLSQFAPFFISLPSPFLTCSTLAYELVLTAEARTETTARRGAETAWNDGEFRVFFFLVFFDVSESSAKTKRYENRNEKTARGRTDESARFCRLPTAR